MAKMQTVIALTQELWLLNDAIKDLSDVCNNIVIFNYYFLANMKKKNKRKTRNFQKILK